MQLFQDTRTWDHHWLSSHQSQAPQKNGQSIKLYNILMIFNFLRFLLSQIFLIISIELHRVYMYKHNNMKINTFTWHMMV